MLHRWKMSTRGARRVAVACLLLSMTACDKLKAPRPAMRAASATAPSEGPPPPMTTGPASSGVVR